MSNIGQYRKLKSKAAEAARKGDREQADFFNAQAQRINRAIIENEKLEKKERAIEQLKKSTETLEWEITDEFGLSIAGLREGKKLFEIKKGISLYSLKILDPEVVKRHGKNVNTSTELGKLKNKADKICKECLVPFEPKKK